MIDFYSRAKKINNLIGRLSYIRVNLKGGKRALDASTPDMQTLSFALYRSYVNLVHFVFLAPNCWSTSVGLAKHTFSSRSRLKLPKDTLEKPLLKTP